MKKPVKNIAYSYLYRDSENYKLAGQAIFENPDSLSLVFIEERIKLNLEDELFFIPELWGLEKPRFDKYDAGFDHDWCEFSEAYFTDEKSDSKIGISIFLENIDAVNFQRNNFIFC